MKGRRTILLLVLFPLLSVAVGWTYRVAEKATIERWIGSELQRIADHYLQPKLRFASLTYQSPLTVVLTDVSLEADDPGQPGGRLRIFHVERAELELARTPRYEEPLVIKRFKLDTPECKFIAMPAVGGKTDFVGYSHLLAPSRQGESAKSGGKDFVQVDQIEMENGTVYYDPRIANTQPLVLDGIHSTLKIDHPLASTGPAVATTAAASRPAKAYALHFVANRAPVFQLETQGHIDTGTGAIDFRQCDVHVDLRPENLHFLPPQLQKILNTYQVQGELTTAMIGTLWPGDMDRSQLLVWLSLQKGHVLAEGYHFGVPKLAADVRMLDGRTHIENLTAEVLGGTLSASAVLPCRSDDTASFAMKAEGLQLERTLRVLSKTPRGTTAPTTYVGRLSGEISASAPMKDWRNGATGASWIKLRDAQLPDMPVLGSIVNGISAIGKVVGVTGRKSQDKADVTFQIAGDKALVEKLTAQSSAMGLRGSGTVGMDGKLDLRVNAGPLEWAEDILGPVGRMMGAVTDKIAGYHVDGTLKRPRVALQMGPVIGRTEGQASAQ